jgi:ABC-type transporter Mla MlaB component
MTSDGAVYDDGVLRITSTSNPPGLVIAGEIDESTYPGLVGALAERTRGLAEIHFRLGGVRYCDLAGLRAIVRVTGAGDSASGEDSAASGRRPRVVVLHEVPAQIAKVLRIVGWDSTPGLALEQPGSVIPPGRTGLAEGDRQEIAVS